MWGKPKTEAPEVAQLRLQCPRMPRKERSIELVLRYVDRMLGYPMSMLDAEVLVALIRAAGEEGRCDDGAGTERAEEAGGEVPEEGG